MPPRLCACYKCVVSGRSWNLSVSDIIREQPLVRACGSVSSLHDFFSGGSETETLSIATEETLVALYFGAAACYACQVFADELWNAQNALGATGRRLEVVYISSDKDADEVFHFMKSRPQWHALRFDDPAVGELRSFLSVRDVPALVIIDNAGLVSRSGRRDLRSLCPIVAWHKWMSNRLASSTTARSPAMSTVWNGSFARECHNPTK